MSKRDVTHWKQKAAMATSYINDNCQCMQNVSQGDKVKVAKFHFIILWHLGVIKEKPQGEEECTPLYR